MKTTFYVLGRLLVRLQEREGQPRNLGRLGFETPYWLYYAGYQFEQRAREITEDQAVEIAQSLLAEQKRIMSVDEVRKFLFTSNRELSKSPVSLPDGTAQEILDELRRDH